MRVHPVKDPYNCSEHCEFQVVRYYYLSHPMTFYHILYKKVRRQSTIEIQMNRPTIAGLFNEIFSYQE